MLNKVGRPVLLLALIGFLSVFISQSPPVVSGLDDQPGLPQVPVFQADATDPLEAEKPLIPSDVDYPFPIVSTPVEALRDQIDAVNAFDINVWYGSNQSYGGIGLPQPWINILGNITLDPGQTMGQITLTYSVNGGAEEPLSIGYDPLLRTRLYNTGDFNIELDAGALLTGSPNEVKIKATDGLTTINKTVMVDYTSGNVWPIPYVADWSTASSVLDLGQVVDGLWSIQGGELRNTVPGYDRLYAMGDPSWTAYEVTVPVTVSSLNMAEWGSPSNGAGIGLIAGWQGHFQLADEQPREGWRRLQALAWFKWNPNGKSGFELRGFGGRFLVQNDEAQIELNQTYIFKLSVQPPSITGMPSTYRFKYWPEGQPEPATWLMKSQGVVGEPVSGSLLLVAHQLQASFGTVTVTPLPQGPFKLTVVPPKNGTVTVDPVKPGNLYNYGDKVSIRAEGDDGYRLLNWGGDLSGDQNPIEFHVTQDVTARATFVESAADLTLTVNVAAGGTVDIVPQKAEYQYGELVTLIPRPNPGYLFSAWSGDHTGSDNPGKIVMNDSKAILASFVPANTTSPVSDDFNACALDEDVWSIVNPKGDGTVQVNGQQLLLNLPAGVSHNVWLEGNFSLRAMQPTENENFEMVAKFDSKVQQRYQMQGFLVEQDSKNYLRFEVHHDGAAIDLYAATFRGGIPEPVITGTRVADTPAYLRVTRSGDTWSFSYSFNGTDYFPAGSFDFTLAVSSSGVFAGNHTPSMGQAPQHTAVVDYFFNTQTPIKPEDGNINVTTQGKGTVAISPDKTTYSCGESITLTATPDNGWSFFAWGGDITGNQSTKVITFTGRTDVTATFVQGSGGGFKTYLPAVLRQ